MLLILIILAAIALGYVLALVYWGALFVLRPVLGIVKVKRRCKQVEKQVLEQAADPRTVRATFGEVLFPPLAQEQMWRFAGRKEMYELQVAALAEAEQLSPELALETWGESKFGWLPIGSDVQRIKLLFPKPSPERKVRVILGSPARRFGAQWSELSSLGPFTPLRSTARIFVKVHHGSEAKDLYKQRRALREPDFAKRARMDRQSVHVFGHSVSPQQDAEFPSGQFSSDASSRLEIS